jgi:tetratricopeptide (TPR) repeat protein
MKKSFMSDLEHSYEFMNYEVFSNPPFNGSLSKWEENQKQRGLNRAKEAKAKCNEGDKLKTLGKYEEAIQCYDKAIELNPSNSAVYHNKGNALQVLGKNEAAIECYNQAIALDSRCPKAYTNKGNALQALGKNEEAIKSYNQAIALDSICPKAYTNKGNALQALGQNEAAIECYNQAIALDSKCSTVFYNNGNALQALGRNEEAIKSYHQAIELNPIYSNVYNNNGVALQALGQNEEALKFYDKAIELNSREFNSSDSHAFYNKGKVLQVLGKNEVAIECYDQAIELNSIYEKIYAKDISISNCIKTIYESQHGNITAKKLFDIINKVSKYQAIVTDYQESKLQFEEGATSTKSSSTDNTERLNEEFDLTPQSFQEEQEVLKDSSNITIKYNYQPYKPQQPKWQQAPKFKQKKSPLDQKEDITHSVKTKININDLIKIEKTSNPWFQQYNYAWINETVANQCSNLDTQKQYAAHFAKKNHFGIKAVKGIYEIAMHCDERLISNKFIIAKCGKIMVFDQFGTNHKGAKHMLQSLDMEDISNLYDIVEPPKLDAMGLVIEQSDYNM